MMRHQTLQCCWSCQHQSSHSMCRGSRPRHKCCDLLEAGWGVGLVSICFFSHCRSLCSRRMTFTRLRSSLRLHSRKCNCLRKRPRLGTLLVSVVWPFQWLWFLLMPRSDLSTSRIARQSPWRNTRIRPSWLVQSTLIKGLDISLWCDRVSFDLCQACKLHSCYWSQTTNQRKKAARLYTWSILCSLQFHSKNGSTLAAKSRTFCLKRAVIAQRLQTMSIICDIITSLPLLALALQSRRPNGLFIEYHVWLLSCFCKTTLDPYMPVFYVSICSASLVLYF